MPSEGKQACYCDCEVLYGYSKSTSLRSRFQQATLFSRLDNNKHMNPADDLARIALQCPLASLLLLYESRTGNEREPKPKSRPFDYSVIIEE